MLENHEKSYPHRRAFIIIENCGILIAEEKSTLSHEEILISAGISKRKAAQIIKKSPRGYYKDNNLIFYQGNFEPLSQENIALARKYKDDFARLFGITPDLKIFRSPKHLALATSWLPISQKK